MTTYYLSGRANWAKVQTPVEAFDPNKPMEYKLDLVMDDKSWDLFEKSECQLKPKETDSGERYVTLRCPTEALFSGKKENFKVTVLDKDNQPYSGLIGNGSEVTCNVDIYQTKKGVGHRLRSVRVEELIPFEGGPRVANEIESPF